MRLIGCDLHASQQSIAMLDRDTGVVVEKTFTRHTDDSGLGRRMRQGGKAIRPARGDPQIFEREPFIRSVSGGLVRTFHVTPFA